MQIILNENKQGPKDSGRIFLQLSKKNLDIGKELSPGRELSPWITTV